MDEKQKKEIQRTLLSLTQMDDRHQYAWMLVSYPKVSVTLATTRLSCKALQEWFVTRHANWHCIGQEPPEAIVCPVKTCCQVFSALIPISASRDFSWVCS